MEQRGVDACQIEIGSAGSIPACSTNYMRGAIELAKKVIPKKWLDNAISETREYYRTGDVLALDRISSATHEIEILSGISWFALDSLLSGILSSFGCSPSATNDDIYTILRQLGWEVSD